MASSFLRFLDHTQRRITAGRMPLDEWSDRRRGRYLTTHNTHNRQTSIPPGGFEPTISAGERPQTYALECAATGIGCCSYASTLRDDLLYLTFCTFFFFFLRYGKDFVLLVQKFMIFSLPQNFQQLHPVQRMEGSFTVRKVGSTVTISSVEYVILNILSMKHRAGLHPFYIRYLWVISLYR